MLGLLAALFLRGSKSRRDVLAETFKYMVGGAVYFWSAFLIFALCYSGFHWYWLPAKMLGDVTGWSLNYLIQRYWTFAAQAHLSEMQHAGRYVFIESVGFVLDYGIVGGLRAVGITPYISFFISAAFFSVWSYLWYKYWVFPDNKQLGAETNELAKA